MTGHDWIALCPDPIDCCPAVGFVTDERAGGIAVFLGTTRAETDPSGQALLALDYEAYPEMAEAQLAALAAECRQRFGVVKLALLHRLGRVGLGEPSVVIAVSTPHRAEAFEACHWLIDRLKAEAAIWKKEVWRDGRTAWVHPPLG